MKTKKKMLRDEMYEKSVWAKLPSVVFWFFILVFLVVLVFWFLSSFIPEINFFISGIGEESEKSLAFLILLLFWLGYSFLTAVLISLKAFPARFLYQPSLEKIKAYAQKKIISLEREKIDKKASLQKIRIEAEKEMIRVISEAEEKIDEKNASLDKEIQELQAICLV